MIPESELLCRIYGRSAGVGAAEGVVVGPGDDCAVVRTGAGDALLTVDQLVEGRHFLHLGDRPSDETIGLIGRKAIARSVSDIGAMGGCARFALAAGALRDSFAREDALFDALHSWASHWGCPLVGGDIARVAGPTVLSVTVVGEPHETRGPVLRAGARPGDGLYVTGAFGGSFESGRHLTFEPRVREGRWLCDQLGDRLHAMMDVSDGLGRDAGRIAEASGVRIEIDARLVPRHADARGWRAALADGEDYELLFAAAGDVPGACPKTGVPITRIGRVAPGAGCVVADDTGALHDAAVMGWDHAG